MLTSRIPPIVIASACVLLAGCTQVKVPEQIGRSLRTVQTEISLGRVNIVSTTTALRNLRDNKGADIKPQLASYNENLADLESKAGGIKAVGTMSEEKTAVYFQVWEQELQQIQDQDMSAAGQERRKQVMDEYAGLKEKFQKLRDAYRPFYANLVDVRTALATDQTAQGAAAARPLMDKAIGQESGVLDRLDDVDRAISKMVGP